MSHLLAETRIVLVHPTLPENVGSVARAMRHFGLRDLVIAEGGVDPAHPIALRVAAGAEEILLDARRVDTFEAALEDVVFAVGTTARPYEAVDMRTRDPRQLALLARDYAQAGTVALVFGTEKHGLPNAYLKRCHQIARIPGTEGTCLNLAMAVNIFGYEWYQAAMAGHGHAEVPLLAAVAQETDIEELSGRLSAELVRVGVFRARDAESKAHTLRRILSQARLDSDEAALVRAIVRKLPSLLVSSER